MKGKKFFGTGYVLLTVGFFFLINPMLHIVDFLPDMFGYVLIFLGLRELSYLNQRVENAGKAVVYLIALSALKLLMTPAVVGSVRDSDKLLAVFCFSIVELLLLLIFRHEFFEGFSYLADRNDGEKTMPAIPNAKFLTGLFFIVRSVFPVVPELTSLLYNGMDDNAVYQGFMETKGYAYVFFAVLSLVAGVLWYIAFVRMLKTFKNDDVFKGKLWVRYSDEYLTAPGESTLRNLRIGIFLLILGCAFFVDTSLDGVRFTPFPLAVLLMCCGTVYLAHISGFGKTRKAAVAAVPIGILYEVYRYIYVDETIDYLDRLPLFSAVINGVTALAFALVMIWFVHNLFNELEEMSKTLISNSYNLFGLRRMICVVIITLHALELTLPSVAGSTRGIYMALILIWTILMGSLLYKIKNAYSEKILYAINE